MVTVRNSVIEKNLLHVIRTSIWGIKKNSWSWVLELEEIDKKKYLGNLLLQIPSILDSRLALTGLFFKVISKLSHKSNKFMVNLFHAKLPCHLRCKCYLHRLKRASIFGLQTDYSEVLIGTHKFSRLIHLHFAFTTLLQKRRRHIRIISLPKMTDDLFKGYESDLKLNAWQ